MLTIILLALTLVALVCAAGAVHSLRRQARLEQQAAQAAHKLERVSASAVKRIMEREEMLQHIVSQRAPTYLGSLSKDLSVAGWKMQPSRFMKIQAALVFLGLVPYTVGATIFSSAAVAFLAPVILGTVLRWQCKRRLQRFNNDYYAFLLVFVSLVRVGMNVVSAMAEACKGLPEESLVREEMEAVLNALNLGMAERDAFSLLGQRFYHQHLISFRNAILVNRRFGGSLSDAVMRIALQSRKQHHLYDKVDAAVSMERGSIWLVSAVMISLFAFLVYSNPAFLAGGGDTISRHIYEVGVLMIVLGFIAMQRLTNIRI